MNAKRNTSAARKTAAAVAFYDGGIEYRIEYAVRADGVVFARHQENTRRGYRWGAWKTNGLKLDVASLPTSVEAGFSTLRLREGRHQGLRLPVDADPAAADTLGALRLEKDRMIVKCPLTWQAYKAGRMEWREMAELEARIDEAFKARTAACSAAGHPHQCSDIGRCTNCLAYVTETAAA